jgi:hypothetical protein
MSLWLALNSHASHIGLEHMILLSQLPIARVTDMEHHAQVICHSTEKKEGNNKKIKDEFSNRCGQS